MGGESSFAPGPIRAGLILFYILHAVKNELNLLIKKVDIFSILF